MTYNEYVIVKKTNPNDVFTNKEVSHYNIQRSKKANYK